jgi:hypothetical protein
MKGMITLPVRRVFKQLYVTPIEDGWFRWPIDWELGVSSSTPYAIWICYPKPAVNDKGVNAERRKSEDGGEHWWVDAAPIKTGMFLEFIDTVWPKRLRSPSGSRGGYAIYMYYKVALRTSHAITLKRVPRSQVPKAAGVPPRQKPP